MKKNTNKIDKKTDLNLEKIVHKMYGQIIEKMITGFALHKIITDKNGTPIDYIFLKINKSFEKMTGLKRKNVLEKKVTQTLPGTEKDPADWIGKYGKVALKGTELRIENYSAVLGKWFHISAYSPQKGYFVTIFEEITERKQLETELTQKIEELEKINKAMIGRELKMIELKKEIEKLKKK